MATDTAFITGGCGFIGVRLAAALSSQFEHIVVFDNLHPQVHGDAALPPPLPKNTLFIQGDVSDAAALKGALSQHRPRLLFHLAAETGTGQSYDEPARYANVNVLGTANLIEAMRQIDGKKSRLVLAGSRAVYGEGACRTEDGQIVVGPARTAARMAKGAFEPVALDGGRLVPCPTPEHLPPNPASVYASTKLMQEYLLSQCGSEGDFETVLLRFQNVYGPGQSMTNPYTGVLSIFASQILKGDTLDIYEDGKIVRDFVYVDDVVRALVAAAAVEHAPSGPINIGSGYPATILEAAKTLLVELGQPATKYRISGKFRPGDIRFAVADIARAETLLGWKPQVSLQEGLTALAAWAQNTFAASGRL